MKIVSTMHNNSDDGKELCDTDEDGNEEEIYYGYDNDHSDCNTGDDDSNSELESDNDDILSPTVASAVKSSPKRKTGAKVINLPGIDDSHLKLDYD